MEQPAEPSDALDCTLCGACCTSQNPLHVPLTGADHARLTEGEQLALTVFEGTRCFMRVVDGACVNLDRSAGRFLCRIYERRPTVCRDYAAGGPACDHDRERVWGPEGPPLTPPTAPGRPPRRAA